MNQNIDKIEKIFSFVVISGEDKGKIIPIKSDFISMGRSSKCDITFNDKSVSRKHIEVLLTDGKIYIRDAGSSNGTFVNNVQIKEPSLLKTNDFIRLGALMLQLVEEKGRGSEITTDVKDEESAENVMISESPSPTGNIKEIISSSAQGEATVNLDSISFELFKDPLKRLNILLTAAAIIRDTIDLQELLEKILDILHKLLRFDNGLIMLKDEITGSLTPKIVRQKSSENEKINISKTLLDKSVKNKVSILVEDATTDHRFKEAGSFIQNKITSAMCAPLICKDQFLGVIYIDVRGDTHRYTSEELEMLNGIANQASMAISLSKLMMKMKGHYRLERESEIAQEIRANYLPKQILQIPNFDIAPLSIPSQQVGGDYYDIIDIGNNKYAIIMIDVSGKGIPAVVLVNSLRLTIQMMLTKDNTDDLTKTLTEIDKRVFVDGKQSMFATVVLGILDKDSRVFHYVNAGHNPPLLFMPDGEIKFLRTSHKLLGFSEAIKCVPEKIFLPPESTLLLYTDGLPDLKNTSKEFFGEKRMRDIVSENINGTAAELQKDFLRKINEFKEGSYQFDDITLMIIKSVR